MDERDVESDTSGDDFLSGAERTPTPNAAAKEEDAEPPLKDAQTATVEDAVHVLLSISTSLAMNDELSSRCTFSSLDLPASDTVVSRSLF